MFKPHSLCSCVLHISKLVRATFKSLFSAPRCYLRFCISTNHFRLSTLTVDLLISSPVRTSTILFSQLGFTCYLDRKLGFSQYYYYLMLYACFFSHIKKSLS